MKITNEGLRLIKEFEGGRKCPYRDMVGVWTIGYGHTANVSARTHCMTQAEIDRLLLDDLERKYGAAVRAAVNAMPVQYRSRINDNRYSALVSLVYNTGPGSIGRGTTIGKALQRGDMAAVARGFMLWVRAGGRVVYGLERRRSAEVRLFNKPVKLSKCDKWRVRLDADRALAKKLGHWPAELHKDADSLKRALRSHHCH